MKHFAKPVLFAACLGCATLAAHAQNPGGMAPTAAPAVTEAAAPPARPSPDRMERRVEHMQVRIAQRLAALKVKLRLEAKQDAAWNAFSAAVQPSPAQLRHMSEQRAELKKLSTPERIDRLRQLRTERNAAMDQRFDATKAFYAQLSPEQQKTFDANAMQGWGGRDRHYDHHDAGESGRGHRGHHGDGHGGMDMNSGMGSGMGMMGERGRDGGDSNN